MPRVGLLVYKNTRETSARLIPSPHKAKQGTLETNHLKNLINSFLSKDLGLPFLTIMINNNNGDDDHRGVEKGGQGDMYPLPPEIPMPKILGVFWLTHYCSCY